MVSRLLVDVHTHTYLPRYAAVLRQRSSVPRILERQNTQGIKEERILILDHEPSGGRPIGPQYWDRTEKLKFMDQHGIDVSIVSSANPWLDFLTPSEAESLAVELNNDLEEYCSSGPSLQGTPSLKRLYGFGLLPLVPGASVSSLVETVKQVASLPHLKGIIMGSKGIGKGLDDDDLEPVWRALSETGLVVFLHPHYGIEGKAWGEKENGHVLPIALGFTFETTIATTRMILSGVFDRHPSLRLLVAHSGGALPQLSSRLASCIIHDPIVASRLKHDARYYISKLYFDAVAYGADELGFVSDVIARSDKIPADGPSDRSLGSQRMLFGTDHPFFPPLSESQQWPSVTYNLNAINNVTGWSGDDKAGVKGGNALKLFGLK